MNVSNDLQGLQQVLASQEVATQPGGKSQKSASMAVQDNATLSPAASLAAQTAEDSDVRMDKVAQIQQAIASGSYNVPSSEVAGKIIEQMTGK